MKRRRVILTILAAFGLAIGGGYVTHWATEPGPGVTEENARRLRRGMSLERVEAILGPPFMVCDCSVPPARFLWQDNGVQVVCGFNGGRLHRASILDDPVEEMDTLTLVDRVRNFLGL